MPTLASFIKSLIITIVLGCLSIGLFIYSGLYTVGADMPHYKITHWLLETLREQSITRSSSKIKIPTDLNTSERLLAGGADYNAMCTGCHLKPGDNSSDLSIGLYPSPPNLTTNQSLQISSSNGSETNASIKRQFWIIKHGIKASGMPSWGQTHSDERIWNMVAFILKLPSLSEDQYQILTASQQLETTH